VRTRGQTALTAAKVTLIASVLVAIGWLVYVRLPVHNQRISCWWRDGHRLALGADVLVRGCPVGEVVGYEPADRGGVVGWQFTLELDKCNPQLAREICRPDSEFRIGYFNVEDAEVENVQAWDGAAIHVSPGQKADAWCTDFVGREGQPLDSRIGPASPRSLVRFPVGWNLKRGDPVYDNETQERVGEVENVTLAESVHAVLAYYQPADTCPYAREGVEHYIARPYLQGMQAYHARTVFTGAEVFVVRTDPQAAARLRGPGGMVEYEGRPEPPPDPELSMSGPALVLKGSSRDVYGVQVGTAVRHGGDIGRVCRMEPEPRSDSWLLTVKFRRSLDATCYRRLLTRYYVVSLGWTPTGLTGHTSTPVEGVFIAAVLDPLGAASRVVDELPILSGNPPKYGPLPGEKRMWLECERAVKPGTGIAFKGYAAGYVLNCTPQGQRLVAEARIYPWAQPTITKNTRLFLVKPEVGLSLTGLISGKEGLELPQLESLAEDRIEFRTPPEAGEQVDLDTHRQCFRLHAKPEDEWLTWMTALTAPAVAVARLKELPLPLEVKFSYRVSTTGLNIRSRLASTTGIPFPRDAHQGWVVALPTGLLGVEDLLCPRTYDGLTDIQFSVSGAPYERGRKVYYTRNVGNGLTFMVAKPLGNWRVCSPEQLGYADKVADLQLRVGSRILTLAAHHLKAQGSEWIVSPEAGCESDWHGSPGFVNSRLVGFLHCADGEKRAKILLLAKDARTRLGAKE